MSSPLEGSDVGGDDVSHGKIDIEHNGRGKTEEDGVPGETRGKSRADAESHEEPQITGINGFGFRGHEHVKEVEESPTDGDSRQYSSPGEVNYDSPEGSLLSPDDALSVQGSLPSSPTSSAFAARTSGSRPSPAPSLRPFDRRFKARLSSPMNSPRALSPAFLTNHSRQSSVSSQLLPEQVDTETSSAPWEVVRWTKLRKITGQLFSEMGKRNFGKPTCLSVSANIALGTSKGLILIFDYHQNLKSIIGPGTKAIEAGAITSLALSADHTTVAGGHYDGSIFTWDLAKPAKPFLQISPIASADSKGRVLDGHLPGVSVLHLGFLGTRHTALVSADSRGMAFSHLATRGLGAVARSVKTSRILGRYPDDNPQSSARPRKPSTVLAFSPLPLGNAEQATDTMGLVAMLTPYLLVIVSTTPIAQTQHKAPRPRELTAHGALSGCLAWFPSVTLKSKDVNLSENISKPKLAFCWSNILTILDIHEVEPSEPSDKDRPASFNFRPRSRWKAEEAIVAVQWLSRSVLGILTITQQLIILEDYSLRMTEKFDLLQKHIYHQDIFSSQLQSLVEQLDDEDPSMHGVVADAFYASFRAYKGRMFVLGHNEVSIGTLSNWADRLVALMEDGNFIGAIELATSYYNGDADRLTVGLPDDAPLRHSMVQEKLLGMISASLRYALGQNNKIEIDESREKQLEELATASFVACVSMGTIDFLFDEVYDFFAEGSAGGIFYEKLEPYVLEGQIRSIPPLIVKELITYFTSKGLEGRLEEMICHMDTPTMDLDQITTLCKRHNLFDALIYVWNQAMVDYITPLIDLLSLVGPTKDSTRVSNGHNAEQSSNVVSALKIFPYLSYTLTGRVYPTGQDLSDESASQAKAEIYFFIFSGKTITWPKQGGKPFLTHPESEEPSFPYLRLILELDAPSFLSVLNEAFEDNYLNGSTERMANGDTKVNHSDEQIFGLSINRQYIVSILLEIMSTNDFPSEDTIYLDMFIARNLPKFPQFILLSGTSLHRVLVGLCNFPSEDIADDCQLSVEYLLSQYRPSDIESLIPLFTQARFYRVLKSIHKADKQYAKLLQTCFDDHDNQETVFDCIEDCLRPRTALKRRQLQEVRSVIEGHAQELASINIEKTAATINTYAPDLHDVILGAVDTDPRAQFYYLRTILDHDSKAIDRQPSQTPTSQIYIEKYVQLMCEFDPSRVSEFLGFLQFGDLRLEEVLPAMEDGGVVDAAVVLMAREGQAKRAMERLTKHLGTLESVLLGLLSGQNSKADTSVNQDAMNEVLEALQKYSGVGIWLCQGQTKTMQTSKSQAKPSQQSSITYSAPALLSEEQLWLDLISAIVRITRNVSADLEPHVPPTSPKQPSAEFESASSNNSSSLIEPSQVGRSHSSSEQVTSSLRSLVQQTFTALLAATTTSSSNTRDSRARAIKSAHSPQQFPSLSFLRILRMFLAQASLSSPSLSDLRSVLASIFSAYAYEESLLALANRLLEKDLFVHVEEAAERRQRGWRPFGQSCEGCRKRVWGPGTGGGVWEAWRKRTAQEEEQRRRGNGKGRRRKGMDEAGENSRERGKAREISSELTADDGAGNSDSSGKGLNGKKQEDGLGPIVVFSCRHAFHQECLERLVPAEDNKDGGRDRNDGERIGEEPRFRCVVCR
ncbi:MAG: Vacuolar protein sorting-associated protein 8 [Sclerophora amabilis]|nr:MAG: Vacuolar protein sorting-associated protein 8 [Sclerophora amabilis]